MSWETLSYLMTPNHDHTIRQIMKNDTAGDLWQQNDGSRNSLHVERSDLCVVFVAGKHIYNTTVKVRYRNFRRVSRADIVDGQVAMRKFVQGFCRLDQS